VPAKFVPITPVDFHSVAEAMNFPNPIGLTKIQQATLTQNYLQTWIYLRPIRILSSEDKWKFVKLYFDAPTFADRLYLIGYVERFLR